MKKLLFFLALLMICHTASADFRRAIFLIHSVGLGMWDRSAVSNLTPPTTIPKEVAAYNGAHGLAGGAAVSMDTVYAPLGPPRPNAYSGFWWRWAQVFSGNDPWGYSMNAYYDSYPIIIIKTGYLTTQNMTNADSVESSKTSWRFILSVMRDHPKNLFILWTGYPSPSDGHSTRAALTNGFVHWATDTLAAGNDQFGPFPQNVRLFDAFHVLASGVDGYCDPAYGSGAEGPGGDHPSNAAVAVFDPIFVSAVFDAGISFERQALPLTWTAAPLLTLLPGGHPQIAWGTLSETRTYRFYLQRMDPQWHSVDSVAGAGTSTIPRTYALSDPAVVTAPATYRIMVIDLDQTAHYSESVTLAVTSVPETVPGGGLLNQNYPNPFNPTTTIRFQLPEPLYVRLTLFNLLGEEVRMLGAGEFGSGVHELVVDARGLASGVYYYTLAAGTFLETKRFILLR